MPDPTPTTAEALAALDHENHDFVDEGDGRPCPVCEAAPTLRALAALRTRERKLRDAAWHVVATLGLEDSIDRLRVALEESDG